MIICLIVLLIRKFTQKTKNKNKSISIHESGLFHILFENVFYFDGIFGYLILFSIVLNTIVENQLHIIDKLLDVVIHIMIEFFLNCSQVHWLLNDLKVIINAVFCRIDWLLEKVSSLCFRTSCQHSLSGFYPCLLDLDFFKV